MKRFFAQLHVYWCQLWHEREDVGGGFTVCRKCGVMVDADGDVWERCE